MACKGVTEPFFACLLKHSEKEGPDDKEAGNRAIQACSKFQTQYDMCIAKVEAAKPKPFYRVQEEYRG